MHSDPTAMQNLRHRMLLRQNPLLLYQDKTRSPVALLALETALGL
jgi:hypothetical protein